MKRAIIDKLSRNRGSGGSYSGGGGGGGGTSVRASICRVVFPGVHPPSHTAVNMAGVVVEPNGETGDKLSSLSSGVTSAPFSNPPSILIPPTSRSSPRHDQRFLGFQFPYNNVVGSGVQQGDKFLSAPSGQQPVPRRLSGYTTGSGAVSGLPTVLEVND